MAQSSSDLTAATTVGFFDFMLADPKSGPLIYTVEKEVDFATSLRAGPYSRSNVADAVARCAATADRSAVCLRDFAPYAPSGGAPIAFIAAPVIDAGVVTGVLIAQLSNGEINTVVTGGRRWRQEGFGATGEAYLVGPDHLVAGVIGKSKYIYDLWGDTVNLASRMKSGSIPDAVQVTRAVYDRLKDQFVFEPRGEIEVKGKGRVEAWLLRL